MATKQAKVIQPEPPIPVEILATSIADIAKAMKAIDNSRLNRKALIILIQAWSRASQRDIGNVLDCLASLEVIYLKAKPKVTK